MSEAQEQARERAVVMLAFAEGKEIEFINHSHSNPRWGPIVTPAWDWRECDYRIKQIPVEPAKPREFWIVENPDGSGQMLYPEKQIRIRERGTQIRVVEVPPSWSDPMPPEPKPLPTGIPQPPEGFEYWGPGRVKRDSWMEPSQDIAQYDSIGNLGWITGARGSSPLGRYALRIGSEIHRLNTGEVAS